MKNLLIVSALLLSVSAYSEVWVGKLKNDKDSVPEGKKLEHLKIHRMDLPDGAAKRMKNSGRFEFLEKDYEVRIDTTDTYYSQLWGLTNISAPQAWGITTGDPDVVVAVVDTGIWTEHPDLQANLWTSDSGTHGWTASGGFLFEGVTDDHGHGTHCAGIISATANNSTGIAGVNWNCKIAGFKFLTAMGSGPMSDALLLYDKIIELKESGVNIRVVNNSWGGSGEGKAFEEAFKRLEEAGILVVNAAGNEGQNIDFVSHWPANATNDNSISVGAIDKLNKKASFSNFGFQNVDLFAPGVGVLSTVPSTGLAGSVSGYRSLSGTSMASPHVAGVAALAISKNPDLSPSEIKRLILSASTPLSDPSAMCVTRSKVDALKALISTVPPVNRNPVLNISHPSTVTGGDTITITAQASDPDGDFVRVTTFSQDGLFPDYDSTNATVSSPSYAIDYVLKAGVSALDGKGGATSKEVLINVLKPNLPPTEFSVQTKLFPSVKSVGVSACQSESQVNPVTIFLSNSSNLTSFKEVLATDDCSKQQMAYSGTGSKGTIAVYAVGENSRKEVVASPVQYFKYGADTNDVFRIAPVMSFKLANQSGYAPVVLSYDLSESYDPSGQPVSAFIERFGFWEEVPLIGTITYTNVGTFKTRIAINGKYSQQVSWFYSTVFAGNPVKLNMPGDLSVYRSGPSYRVAWADTSEGESSYRIRVTSYRLGVPTIRDDVSIPPDSFAYACQWKRETGTVYDFEVWAMNGTESGPIAKRRIMVL